MTRKPLILFICTGNSCRSQMAEGFARVLAGQRAEIQSAGLEPVGVNPRAVEIMAEVCVDISAQTSKAIDTEILKKADLVVTLCGDARDRCPAIPPNVRREHWPIADPALARGGEDEIMSVFRAARNEIQTRVAALLATFSL